MALQPLIPDPNAPATLPLAQQMQAIKAAQDAPPPEIPKLSGQAPMGEAQTLATLGQPGLKPLVTTPMNERIQQIQDQIAKYNNPQHPSGFWHSLGRVLKESANVVGDTLGGGITQAIPGADWHNAIVERGRENELDTLQQRQQQGQTAASEDFARSAQAADELSQTAQREAAAKVSAGGEIVYGKDGAVAGWHDGQGNFHGPDDPNIPQGVRDVMAASKPKLEEVDKPLGATTPALNQAMTDRWQVLNPGKPLPPEYTLPPNATRGDYDRIDKALSGVETAQGTEAQRKAAAEARAMTRQMAEGAATDRQNTALDRESKQYGAPYQKGVDAAESQLEKIDEAMRMLNSKGAEGQALGIPKVLTALVSGQGTGVRITQAELNSIAAARGVKGDTEGFFNSISGAGKLSRAQVGQLNNILNDARDLIQKKASIHKDALDAMNGASDRAGFLAADKTARQNLSDLETHGYYTGETIKTKDGKTVVVKAVHPDGSVDY